MAKHVFILCEETMRSARSGFFIEGTDLQMDFPEDYPLPLETEVIENGVPVALRVIPNCRFIEKDKQIKAGYPINYVWQDSDRDRVNFHYGRLELDDKRDGIYLDFITRAGWYKGNEDKRARPQTKTIYQRYDEEKILVADLEEAELELKAKQIVFALDTEQVRDLYRLACGGTQSSKDLTVLHMKKNLLTIAANNPKFIINGIASRKDRIVVLLTRAIEQRIISLDIAGAVAIYSSADKDWIPLIEVQDDLGQENKFNRAVEYLCTDNGQIELSIIEKQLEDSEKQEAAAPTKKTK